MGMNISEVGGDIFDNATKNDLIVEIKKIIENYGGFSTYEVETSYSPTVHGQKGNLSHLIEYFNQDDVDVEVYSDETEVDSYSLKYEELDDETLEYLLEIAQAYQEIKQELGE